MLSFSQFLNEGVHDPGIFKVIFMAGGPGSGKSFIANKSALKALGFKIINSDDAYEAAMKRAGLELNPEDIFSDQGQNIRDKAKKTTVIRKRSSLRGRQGLAIDGTGRDFAKIKQMKREIEKLGYESAMIFVNTKLETAHVRNKQRARTVPDKIVDKSWNDVQRNLGKFQKLFGRQHMYIIDNNDNDNVQLSTTHVYKKLLKWSKQDPSRPQAKKWIALQTNKR